MATLKQSNGGEEESGNASAVCKGHPTIAEHLSCHDIVLHFHTERPGEWAILPGVFASATLQAVSNSMTSSLIVAELAAASGASGSKGTSTGLSTRAAVGSVRSSARNQVSRVSGASAAAAAASKRRRHLFHFDLNPADSADGVQGSAALIDYLGEALAKYYNGDSSAKTAIKSGRFSTFADADLADSVGYIKLTRPTVYVFPGGQGDCALFGLDNGFTMLMDGGFLPAGRSFWNFVRHLQRLDSVVVSVITL